MLCCPTCCAVFVAAYRCCPQDGTPLVERTRDPMLAEVVAGRYVVTSLIGIGGTSRIYSAYDVRRQREVALKVLHGDVSADKR